MMSMISIIMAPVMVLYATGEIKGLVKGSKYAIT